MTEPVQTRTPVSIFTTQEGKNLIDQEVQELLAKQAVHFVSSTSQDENSLISSLFVVPKKGGGGGGHRLVINLKPLNSLLPYKHFQMESINMLKDLLRIAYLDGFLIMEETRQLALQHAATTLNLLEGLGFVVNYPKSLLIPSQEIEFLGYIVNSLNLSLSLPKDKIKKVRQSCQKLLDNPVIIVRKLAKFLGLLSASIQAVFPAPLHYRYLQHAKNSVLKQQKSYEALVNLDPEAVQEVQWWRENLTAWNEKALLHQSTDLTSETDASLQGWGAHCQGISTGRR